MPGTLEDALALAKARWAQLFAFDLDDQTWLALFQAHRPGEILQAVTLLRGTRDLRPERVYERFLQLIDRVTLKQF